MTDPPRSLARGLARLTTGVVLMAYGTPRTPADIEPYYTDIRRGRPPTPEQLADLTRRYDAIGGISPLAALTAEQAKVLQAALDERRPGEFVVGIGLKHAAPKIEEGVAALVAAGAERIIGLVLAPHYSALSIGEYLGRARASADTAGLPFADVESWAVEPAYVTFLASAVCTDLDALPGRSRVVFTAHSLPKRIVDAGDPYPDELRATATAVTAQLGLGDDRWSIGWQSAGRTPEPWLGPDVLEIVDALAADPGVDGLLVCPCGFVADHLEVLYDLDIEAAGRAARAGLAFARTASMNADPTVLGALADRVVAL
jgi:ferrochelatase